MILSRSKLPSQVRLAVFGCELLIGQLVIDNMFYAVYQNAAVLSRVK